MSVSKVVEIHWSVGMGKPSLSQKINDCIRAHEHLHNCVGVERVTEFHWLVLFGNGPLRPQEPL